MAIDESPDWPAPHNLSKNTRALVDCTPDLREQLLHAALMPRLRLLARRMQPRQGARRQR